MFSSKRYGQGRVEHCPFCGKNATVSNEQGVAVCLTHRDENLEDMRCACGRLLEMKHSSYGAFFVCMECGPVSMHKALEINDVKPKGAIKMREPPVAKGTEIVVRSDDPRYFD